MDYGIRGKVAVVTGGGSGVATAQASFILGANLRVDAGLVATVAS